MVFFKFQKVSRKKMNHEQIAAKLEEKNIRPSVQRMAIYNFLAENPVHPTVDTIYTALSPQMPTLSRTTVYNTLRQFSECGLVQTITIEDGELRYDADTSNHLPEGRQAVQGTDYRDRHAGIRRIQVIPSRSGRRRFRPECRAG